MEYLIFKTDGGEPKVTGIKTGTGQASFDDEFWSKNPHIDQFMWNHDKNDLRFITGLAPEFSLDLINVPLHKSAKYTDVIYLSSLLTGFIVSSKLKRLLEGFHIPPHTYYKVTFQQPDKSSSRVIEVSGYWWLYFQKETGQKNVDFKNSDFDTVYHEKYLKMNDKDLMISTYEEYMDLFLKTPPSLPATKLLFNKSFDDELDLWGCRFLSVKNYISPRLSKALIENKITGYLAITSERAKFAALKTGIPHCELVFA